MDTIDNLVIERNVKTEDKLTLSPLSFRFLVAIISLERFAYYGLRSVAVFYAIDQFGLIEENAYEQYANLLLIVYVSNLIGGFLGDFLLGARNGIFLGLFMCVLGSILVAIPISFMFYVGMIAIAIGTGFFKMNAFSLIGRGSSPDNVHLEKRFISMYMFINLGALLSSIVIGFIGIEFGQFYSLLMVLFLYALSTGLMFAIPRKQQTSELDQKIVAEEPRPITKSMLIIMLVIISASVFWIVFEKYADTIFAHRFDFTQTFSSEFVKSNIWSISTLLLVLFSIPYYFIAKYISVYLKMSIALILIGLIWGASTYLYDTQFLSFGMISLVLFLLVEAISDLLIVPTTFTLLAVHSSKKYMGLIFAVYGGFTYFGMRIVNYLESSYFDVLFHIGLIVLLVASIVLFLVLPILSKEKTTSQDPINQDF